MIHLNTHRPCTCTCLCLPASPCTCLQVPPHIIAAFHELYGNYKAAVLGGGAPGADPNFVARVMAAVSGAAAQP
jgi:hypothetical protein